MVYLWSFGVALLVSVILTPVMRVMALRLNWVQNPRPASVATHVKPIPFLGGLAIYLGCLVGIAITIPIQGYLSQIILGATIMVMGGVIDDVIRLPTIPKLATQFLAAGVIVLSDPGRGVLIPVSIIEPQLLNELVTILWLVGITNAVNFLDIMDGLAAGVSAIAAGGFFLLAVIGGQSSLAVLCLALVGGSLGFLVFNFEPAKIFMGDTGSQLLGLSLAAVALVIPAGKEMGAISLSIPLVILGVPLFEMTFTVVVRSLSLRLPWKGSKDHFPLRLFALGHPVRLIVLSSYAAGLGLAGLGVLLSRSSIQWTVVALIALSVAAALTGVRLSRVVVPGPDFTPRRSRGYVRNPSDLQATARDRRNGQE